MKHFSIFVSVLWGLEPPDLVDQRYKILADLCKGYFLKVMKGTTYILVVFIHPFHLNLPMLICSTTLSNYVYGGLRL